MGVFSDFESSLVFCMLVKYIDHHWDDDDSTAWNGGDPEVELFTNGCRCAVDSNRFRSQLLVASRCGCREGSIRV
jgi:hypothetical protein